MKGSRRLVHALAVEGKERLSKFEVRRKSRRQQLTLSNISPKFLIFVS